MAGSEKAFKMFNRIKVLIVEVASLVLFVALVVTVVAHELAFLLLWHW
jgi:hypothetical protein